MALTITATITVADDQAYTAREAAILTALQAHPSQGAAAVVITNPVAAVPAAKAAPKAKATTTRATPVSDIAVLDTRLDEPEPAAAEPAAAEPEADLVGEKEYTLDDAVTLATRMVSDGKAPAVKAALAAAGGAKRVSELKGAAISTFITAAQA